MELSEWLSVLGGGLFCGVKILKRFYGWATWVAERKKEWREWRLQGVKPCSNQRDKIDRFDIRAYPFWQLVRRGGTMKTSTAEKHGYICPHCGDEMKKDRAGRGFVAHKTNGKCRKETGFEEGEKDE